MKKNISVLPIILNMIDEDGIHILVEAKINGKKANLLIDTGASKSVFDINRAKRFVDHSEFEASEKLSNGLGTNSMESKTTNFKKFKLGDVLIENFSAVLLDMTHINESYTQIGFKAIDGVIGSDIMYKYKATIDYKKQELKLRE